MLGRRMVGIDLSSSAEGLTKNYMDVLEEAGTDNLLRTVHFDELRMNMRKNRDAVSASIGNVESAKDQLDRIGHGLPLAPLHDSLKGRCRIR